MKLFIDDLRDPPAPGYTVLRSAEEAMHYISSRPDGLVGVSEIALDHDLGEGHNGHEFMKWLIHEVVGGSLKGACRVRFTVHSANPVGRANIEADIAELMRICRGRA